MTIVNQTQLALLLNVSMVTLRTWKRKGYIKPIERAHPADDRTIEFSLEEVFEAVAKYRIRLSVDVLARIDELLTHNAN